MYPADDALVDSASVGPVMTNVLDRLAAMPDAQFHRWNFRVGGCGYAARFTDPGLAALYRQRFAETMEADAGGAASEGGRCPHRIDVVETSALGWPLLRWHEPGWQMHVFDAAMEAFGLRAEYPFFEGCWTVQDAGHGRSLQLSERLSSLPAWHAGAPLRLQLHWSLQDRRRRMAHAATLGIGGEGILIAGEGGAGKSGTTLAGIAHGLNTVGDDYVLIDQQTAPIARPIYRLVKQDSDGLARIPGLPEKVAHLPRNWQGKCEFDPETIFPGSMAAALRLRAIVLPVVAREPASRLQRIGPGDVIPVLTRSTLSLLPGDERAAVMHFAALATRLPCYRLLLSQDAAEIAGVVRALLAELASR